MRLAPALLVLALAACHTVDDARRSGQVRYEGHTLEEWWTRRREPETEHDAQIAMHMLGAAAVPFLAEKAASHDMGDMISGSVALESMCLGAVPAMQAARATHPSAALDAAIRRVQADAAARVRTGVCATNGDPIVPESRP